MLFRHPVHLHWLVKSLNFVFSLNTFFNKLVSCIPSPISSYKTTAFANEALVLHIYYFSSYFVSPPLESFLHNDDVRLLCFWLLQEISLSTFYVLKKSYLFSGITKAYIFFLLCSVVVATNIRFLRQSQISKTSSKKFLKGNYLKKKEKERKNLS